MRQPLLGSGLLLLGAVLLAGCGGGALDVPAATSPAGPTLILTAPAADVVVPLAVGGTVRITYVDADRDSTARTEILADVDGKFDTTDDQIVIATDRPDGDGAEQSVDWIVDDERHGIYRIIGRTTDGGSMVTATAPGRVELNAPPSFQIREPSADAVTCRDGIARIAYASDDPDDQPFDTVWIDTDGDAETAADRYAVVDQMPGGTPRDALVRLWGVPLGTHPVIGFTDDEVNPRVMGKAPGTLEVRNVGWAGRVGGASADDAFGAALFPDGSWVVTGTFRELVTLGDGEAPAAKLESAGSQDLFVVRYAPDGTLTWARSDGGLGGEYASDVAVCGTDECVVVGYFSGEATFGAGEANETTLVPVAGHDAYLARYDRHGLLRWLAQCACTEFIDARTVAGLPNGGCVVAGTFGGVATLGAGETNQTVLSAVGVYDVFLAEYDAAGRLVWARSAGGIGLDQAWGIAAFEDGSCAVCGNVNASATFGAGYPEATVVTPRAGLDMFVARYAAGGRLLWVRSGGGLSWDTAYGVAAGPDGRCIVTGSFDEAAAFDTGTGVDQDVVGAGGRDGFVAQYDEDGTLAWVRTLGGTGFETVEDVTAFPDGMVAVTGAFQGEATFGLGDPDETDLEGLGVRDAFVACYHPDGEIAWAWGCGGAGQNVGRAIAGGVDGSGLVVGSFQDAIIVGAGWPHETLLTSEGNADGFMIRFNGDGGL